MLLLRRAVRRVRAEGPVWALVAAMGFGAAVMYVAVVRHLDAPAGELRLPWWALALAFAVAEVFVVRVSLRQGAFSLSLAEVPLVCGLFLAQPSALLVAQIAGPGLVLLFADRRHAPVRTAFNLAQFALVGALCIAVFGALTPDTVEVGPGAWVAALAATLTGTLVACLLIALGMSLAEERVRLRQLGQMLGADGLVTVANTCLALAGVAVLLADPRAAWLLLGPAAVMFLAYRAFVQERSRHRSLEFLYDVTRTVHCAPTMAAALSELLTRTRGAFHAEVAEAYIYPADGGPALLTAVSTAGVTAVVRPDESAVPLGLRRIVEHDGPCHLRPGAAGDPALEAWMRAGGRREVLLAPMAGEHGLIGAIVLSNRVGRAAEFSHADLTLLETLANHAAVALEQDRLEQELGELTEVRDRLEHRAFHDPLTGLANRVLFTQSVEAVLARPDGRAVVLFLDLDDFKRVNDRFGHEIGDELLVAFTRRLRSCLRTSDLPARLGGDEFAVLLDRGDHERAMRIAERIKDAFGEPFKLSAATLRLGASTGIAIGSAGTASAAELLRNADLAMYAAKQHDKGNFELYDQRQAAPLLRRHALTDELERAVARSGLEVSYQPIVELAGGRVVGAEALARWHRADGEQVSPVEFIPLAERAGLIGPIGELVRTRACSQLQRWERASGGSGLLMHVNLSAAELHDAELVPRVADVVEEAGIEPGRLVLEVTETALLEDARLAVGQLERLRAMGVRIAIDDFGTGYSSLHTLQRLPIDILKMARPFLEQDGLAFQTTILQLAAALGVEVVAEGIETPGQLQRLRELGCAMGQGFHLSPPLSGVALLDWAGPSLSVPGEPPREPVGGSEGERDLAPA